ncbi:MAG: peptidyl-prolyl cis-trans isomerase [Acetivibrio sp.]
MVKDNKRNGKKGKYKRGAAVGFLSLMVFVMLSGCNYKTEKKKEQEQKEPILMAVGEETVSLEEAGIYAYFLKHQYEDSMGKVIWDYKLEGKTFETYAKEEIQNLLIQIKILKQEAKKQEILLTEDEQEEARACGVDYLGNVSKEDKKTYGLTLESLTRIYGENILANKMFEISTNDVNTNISDDEVKQITIQYIMVMTKGMDQNNIRVNMTEEEKKKAKSKAKKLWKEAKETTDFLSLAESNTDAKDAEIAFSKKDAPEDLKETVFQLKNGELSPLIEGENGYYIVYCVNDDDEDATAQKKEELIEERQRASFEKKFAKWSGEYEIVSSTTLWNKIKL